MYVNGYVRLSLKNLGSWCGGCTPSMANRKYWEDGQYPWISSKDMKSPYLEDTQDHITDAALQETSIKLLPENITAIVVRSGILKHTLPVAYVPKRVTINQDIRALIPGEFILPRFAYHLIAGNSNEILVKAKKQGGTVDSLDTKLLMDFMVTVPSIKEQQRIVSILDRFDTLCNDLAAGLPAEIEARNRQYEYYRDKLLNFPIRSN